VNRSIECATIVIEKLHQSENIAQFQ